jgi:putative phosphoribosyl transferase
MDGAFADRLDAGRQLAAELEEYRGSDALVLGMARGGVAVAYAVAEELDLPLRALIVRKIGAPGNPELAVGAVSETGIRWVDYDLARATGASDSFLEREVARQIEEARRRQREYAGGPGLASIRDHPAIVVDDGVATGASALVAVRSVRALQSSEVVLATPAAAPQAVQLLRPQVDRLVALRTPDPFMSVGLYYRDFSQLSDAEVVRYLRQASA